jgi:hypothetical protein
VAYDPSIIAAIKRRAAQVSDPGKRNKYLRAALQTGIVESGLQNLSGGDADSAGWRQERASLYKNPTNVNASVNRFFQELEQFDKGQPSWELAADVQRPAAQYRGRYKDVADQATKLRGGRGGGGGKPTGGTASTPSQIDQVPEATPTLTNQLADLKLPERAAVSVTAPTAPAFAAKAAAPGGYQTPVTGWQPKARFDEDSISEAFQTLAKARAAQVQAPAAQTDSGGSTTTPRSSSGGKSTSTSTGNGTFKVSGPQPGRLKPELVSFAKKVADVYGGTLTGSDGSTHSKYTTTGNVSQHYTGNATDIFTIGGKPARGKVLIEAGRAALEAAGMPRSKARKAGIGLYNVGSHQIIFGTNSPALGGDHTDHLHISAR